MGERGSSGGDRAGGVVGVVVSKEQSLRGDFQMYFDILSGKISLDSKKD